MEALSSFLDMGGYGGFIWGAYGMVTVVLVVLFIASKRFVASSQQQLDGLTVDRPHRKKQNSEVTDEA